MRPVSAIMASLFLSAAVSVSCNETTAFGQPPTSQLKLKQPEMPIEYKAFFPDRWKAKYQTTKLFPWEGDRVVVLTTTADLDPTTMAVFLKRLDVGWKLYADLVGQSPRPFKQHNGKVTFACVPDPSFTCGTGCGYMGMTGIEIAGFYRGFRGGPGDYETVHKDRELFFDYYYEMGRNYYLFEDRISLFSTGFPVAMRHVCMEDVKKWKDQDTSTRGWIDRFEEAFSKSTAAFEQAFVPFGAKGPFRLNDINGKPFESADLTILYASGFLKLRKDHGGNQWVRRFHRHLFDCPMSPARDVDGAKGQLLNWVVAASLAAGTDLTPVFRDRWRFPLAPPVWSSLGKVDWTKAGLTADNVFDTLPIDQLPLGVAMTRPNFLSPERRKQNLLADGSFEDDSAGKWKVSTWRDNKLSGTIEGGAAKEGQKAAVIRTTVTDDSHFDQTVAVKPGTRYLLSGWIKTKDVAIDTRADQTYGKAGATLSIWGGYEHSRSIIGTTDWTYVMLIFDARDRTEVTVCARLGYWFSIAAGEAWFDDINLIAIGESPPRSAAQPRQITGRQTQVVNGGQAALTLKGHSASVYSVTFSPDGKRLASGSIDGTVKLWDATSGLETLTLKGHTDDRVKCVAFSPDGKRLVSASLDGTVKLWDSTSGRETLTLKGHTGAVASVAFSADGNRLASASLDKSVRVWNATSGQATLTLNGHTNYVWSVAFSPDGKRLASASADLTVKVWDASSGQEMLTLKGHTNLVDIVVFSPDGKWLASASNDQTIKVWDAKSGQEAFTLKGHAGAVYGIAYSPDGTRLASGSFDKTVKVWDARSGQEKMTLSGHSEPVMSVAFSPDGKRLASASGDQSVKIWELTH